ncbi:MAG: hypothetical protein PHH98_05735 [Candidatus Gracilibacteria bacterium]|nr:hypothetical protein [Candidatus Gracilibacteria bacterium]
MGLEDFSPELDTSESLGKGNEAVEKISEKVKESSKKASAGIQRTQQDEKKAKKYDFLLAGFLVKIIVDKKYDFILQELFKVMSFGYTSNFVLGILSLINTEISNKIREHNVKLPIVFNYKKGEKVIFDDSNIDIEIKNRINYWIEDIIDSVTIDYSNIQTKKIIELLESDDENLSNYISNILGFFLHNLNISISKSTSINISNFIIGEVLKSIKKLNLEEV